MIEGSTSWSETNAPGGACLTTSALAGEAIDGLGEAEYNPFLEDGTRSPDDETAGLALAATIAGADEDEADSDAGTDANPFLATGDGDAKKEAPEADFNPFLADAEDASEEA